MLRVLLKPAGRCGLYASYPCGGSNIALGRLRTAALPVVASASLDTCPSPSAGGRFCGLRALPPIASLRTGATAEQRITSTSPGALRSLGHIRHAPMPALLLGLAGLVPFALTPTYMMSAGLYDPELVVAQTVYGATILAFLGGVRWGSALPDSSPVQPSWFNLTTSVMPPLLAWAALLLPQPWPLPAIIGSLLGVAYADLQLIEYPAWFRGLRIVLTAVAVTCLTLSVICWLVLPTGKDRGGSATTSAASGQNGNSGGGTKVAAIVAVPASAAGAPSSSSSQSSE